MSDFVSEMNRFLDEYCNLYKFSGIFRVAYKGEELLCRSMGFADIEHRIPIGRDSVFTLYSMTKPLCTIGLMRLVDRGLVALDAHPGKYVPEAASFHPDVTLYHMLHHISGLPDFSDFPDLMHKYSAEGMPDLRKMISEMAERCEKNAPGADRYENTNFALPALIIENVSGMSYPEYMRSEVFEPLGMKNALIDRNGLIVPNRVYGYDIDGTELRRASVDLSYMFGSGDAVGTVDDVSRLGLAVKEHLLLSDRLWDEILTPVPGGAYGMGCTVTVWHGKKRITHNGGHLGFRTLHVQLPDDDFDLILLSNSCYGNSRYTLAEAAYTAFYGADDADSIQPSMDSGFIRAQSQSGFASDDFLPKIPPRVPLTPAEEARVIGNHGYFSMEKNGDDYLLLMNHRQRLCCRHVGGGRFYNTVIDEQYNVDID